MIIDTRKKRRRPVGRIKRRMSRADGKRRTMECVGRTYVEEYREERSRIYSAEPLSRKSRRYRE